MENVLISILMTAYNREKYIAIAIESVLLSTYKDFELIITDDLSTDKTVDIAKSFQNRDNRVQVYVNEKNLGDYHNRNRAACYAKGKYIKYLDADDYIYPHGLEQMLYYIEKANNNNIALGVFSLAQDRNRPFPLILTPTEIYRRHFLDDGVLATAPCSTIINRELFLKEGGFTGKKMVGDVEMWLKLAAKYDTILMPGHYCWYRVHSDQEINSFNKFRGDYHNVLIAALTNKNCPLCRNEKEIFLKKINRSFAKLMLFFLIRKRDFRLLRLNLKSTKLNLFKAIIHLLR